MLELIASEQHSLPYYKIWNLENIEIALKLLLYLKKEWCESKVKGQVSFLVLFFSILYLLFSSHINFDKQKLIF